MDKQIEKQKQSKNTKCKGVGKEGKSCYINVTTELFCKNHKYMESYTEEMMNNLTFCTGCRKMYYLENGKQCDKCKERSKLNREKENEVNLKCKLDECKNGTNKNKENDENKYKEYCGKHQLYGFRDEVKELNKFTCYNDVRGCRSIMDTNNYSKCDTCREKERNKDRIRNENKPVLKGGVNKKSPTKELSLANQLYNQYAIEQQNKTIINDDLLKQIDDEEINDSDDDVKDEEINDEEINDLDDEIINKPKNNKPIKINQLACCNGYTYNRQKCDTIINLIDGYCKYHLYFKHFTQDEINDIINNTHYTNIKLCKTKCMKWHTGEKLTCDKCLDRNRLKQEKFKQNQRNKLGNDIYLNKQSEYMRNYRKK